MHLYVLSAAVLWTQNLYLGDLPRNDSGILNEAVQFNSNYLYGVGKRLDLLDLKSLQLIRKADPSDKKEEETHILYKFV